MEHRSKAVDVLRERLVQLEEEYKRDRAELEQAIDRLTDAAKNPKPVASVKKGQPVVASGRWKGMGITDSVHAYLSLCQSGPVPFDAVMDALRSGGVQLGDPEKPNRFAANVKTTIVNNRNRFRYDKHRDTVTLRAAL